MRVFWFDTFDISNNVLDNHANNETDREYNMKRTFFRNILRNSHAHRHELIVKCLIQRDEKCKIDEIRKHDYQW